MKMGILFSGLLWGSFFILLGISVILKHTLHVDIPVARVFFGLFLVYLGVQILTGGRRQPPVSGGTDVFFNQGVFKPEGKTEEYNVIFGTGVVDLTGLEAKDADLIVKANTIFGNSTVRLKASTPAVVKATSAFGVVKLPNGNHTVFGTFYYRTKGWQEGKPCLHLEVNSVFGETVIVEE